MASNVHIVLLQCCRLVFVHIFLAVTPKEAIQGNGGTGEWGDQTFGGLNLTVYDLEFILKPHPTF